MLDHTKSGPQKQPSPQNTLYPARSPTRSRSASSLGFRPGSPHSHIQSLIPLTSRLHLDPYHDAPTLSTERPSSQTYSSLPIIDFAETPQATRPSIKDDIAMLGLDCAVPPLHIPLAGSTSQGSTSQGSTSQGSTSQGSTSQGSTNHWRGRPLPVPPVSPLSPPPLLPISPSSTLSGTSPYSVYPTPLSALSRPQLSLALKSLDLHSVESTVGKKEASPRSYTELRHSFNSSTSRSRRRARRWGVPVFPAPLQLKSAPTSPSIRTVDLDDGPIIFAGSVPDLPLSSSTFHHQQSPPPFTSSSSCMPITKGKRKLPSRPDSAAFSALHTTSVSAISTGAKKGKEKASGRMLRKKNQNVTVVTMEGSTHDQDMQDVIPKLRQLKISKHKKW